METKITQKITIESIVDGETYKIIISDREENLDYIGIGQGPDCIVFHKSMIDSVIRALAKFNL